MEWFSPDGRTPQTYWGGAEPDSRQCACAKDNNCAGPLHCNCDVRDNVWRFDEGYFIEKDRLPVKRLEFHTHGLSKYRRISLNANKNQLPLYPIMDHEQSLFPSGSFVCDFILTLKICSLHVYFLFHLPTPGKATVVVLVKLFVCPVRPANCSCSLTVI